MKVYRLDHETFYADGGDGYLWELLRGFPPSLITPATMDDGEHLNYKTCLRHQPVRFGRLPSWVQGTVNELTEAGYMKGCELSE